jgi:uncharacterized protein (TIRG00374 family)
MVADWSRFFLPMPRIWPSICVVWIPCHPMGSRYSGPSVARSISPPGSSFLWKCCHAVCDTVGALPLQVQGCYYMKFLLKLFVSVVLVGAIVWYLWRLGDFDKLGKLMTSISPLYIPLILIVYMLDRGLMTFKWGQLLRSRGLHLPFFRGLKIYCASMVWGLFLPVTIGADAFRAFSTSRIGLDSHEVVASILIERMIGFLSALFLGLLSLGLLSFLGILDNRFSFVWGLGSAMLVGTIVIFTASLSQSVFNLLHDRLLHWFRDIRIVQRLRQLHTTYKAYQHDKRNLAIFFGLTFVEQFTLSLSAWLVARSLGIDVGLPYIAGAVPLAFLIARFPVSVSGFGIFEGAFMLLMSLAGIPAVEAIAIVFVSRVLETLSWLPWWVAHVLGNANFQSLQGVVKTENRKRGLILAL